MAKHAPKRNLFGIGEKHLHYTRTASGGFRAVGKTPKRKSAKTRAPVFRDDQGFFTRVDPDSRFDTREDAERFLKAWKRNPEAAKKIRTRKRNDVIDDAAAVALATTGAVYQGLSVPYELTVQAAQTVLDAKDAAKKALKLNPTDRAYRYRANKTPPPGPKHCGWCGKTKVEVGHLDGHEENNATENLLWTCRSCNVLHANNLRKHGFGRKTHQYNPATGGATTWQQWVTATTALHGSGTIPLNEAIDLVHNTPPAKRSQFAREIWERRRSHGTDSRWNPAMTKKNGKKHNPPADAERMYEKFHGRPATETTIVEEEVHEHEHLTILGPLVEAFVETPTGLLAHITFDEEDLPFLCSSEDGTQLYLEKGDQAIDLKALKMDSEDWLKDRMILGRFAAPIGKRSWNITYRTKKRFDEFKEIDYQHDLGEETGDRPSLEYEPRSQKLFIAGGRYRIDLPMIGMSPGIEN